MAVKSSKNEGLTDYIPKIHEGLNSTFLVDDVGQGDIHRKAWEWTWQDATAGIVFRHWTFVLLPGDEASSKIPRGANGELTPFKIGTLILDSILFSLTRLSKANSITCELLYGRALDWLQPDEDPGIFLGCWWKVRVLKGLVDGWTNCNTYQLMHNFFMNSTWIHLYISNHNGRLHFVLVDITREKMGPLDWKDGWTKTWRESIVNIYTSIQSQAF